MLQKQGVEISRATAAFTVTVPGKRGPARQNTDDDGWAGWAGRVRWAERGQVGRAPGRKGRTGGTGRMRGSATRRRRR